MLPTWVMKRVPVWANKQCPMQGVRGTYNGGRDGRTFTYGEAFTDLITLWTTIGGGGDAYSTTFCWCHHTLRYIQKQIQGKRGHADWKANFFFPLPNQCCFLINISSVEQFGFNFDVEYTHIEGCLDQLYCNAFIWIENGIIINLLQHFD